MIFQCKRIIESSDEKSDEASLHQGLEKAVEHFLRGNPAFFCKQKASDFLYGSRQKSQSLFSLGFTTLHQIFNMPFFYAFALGKIC